AKDLRPPASVSPAEEFSPKAGNSTPTATPAVHNITNPTPTTTKTPKPTTTTTPNLNTCHETIANCTCSENTYYLKKPCRSTILLPYFCLNNFQANGTFIVQPNDTKTSGSCGETNANLTLSFKDGFITFLFNKVILISFQELSQLCDNDTQSNTARTAKNESIHLFAAKIGHSYSCRNESLYMGNGLYLDISPARMQAFNVTNNNFGVRKCPNFPESFYRVAIAVGVTLLVLILVVVVAYLLGRRKRTDGYQSL
uniref:Macrosialin-like n=1 Tax=Acanthochromis polyacanthus TaxID=80966 RepID=A0A3Q1ES66_9TELE